MASILELLARSVAAHPDRVALVDAKGRATTFADLDLKRRHLAARWSERGLQPGDRVLMALPVSADLYAGLAALWTLRAVAVFPEPALGLAGLRHAVRATQPVALCASGAYLGLALLPELWGCRLLWPSQPRQTMPEAPAPEGRAEDTALISFTSGTSGQPKGIARSHGFLSAQFDALAPMLRSAEEERVLVGFPVFALLLLGLGQTAVLPDWRLGAPHRVTAQALTARMADQRITRALLPPVLCEALSQGPRPPALRSVFTGGGPVFPDLVDRLQAGGGADSLSVHCVYGSTEAEPIAHLDAADITEADRAAMADGAGLLAGPVVAPTRVRIVADEIWVSGPHVNQGYLDPRQDDDTKMRDADGVWHRTGDLGRLDDAGRLWLWGRKGADISHDGRRLLPFAVEVAARAWPGVRAAALTQQHGAAVLAISGDQAHLPTWQSRARGLGVETVLWLADIPMDKRHRSKVDQAKLTALLRG